MTHSRTAIRSSANKEKSAVQKMADHQEQTLTPREMVRAHLPIVLDLIKTASLVVVAVSGMLVSHHTHEMSLEIKSANNQTTSMIDPMP